MQPERWKGVKGGPGMSNQLEDMTPGKVKGDWRWKFISALAETGNVSAACHASKVSRTKAYRHRERFPVFRRKWDEALVISIELLEHYVRGRAFNPKDPMSGVLSMFLLKAHKPATYRDNYTPPLTGDNIDVTKLSDEELDRIISGKGLE
jgi:hypothetical protein